MWDIAEQAYLVTRAMNTSSICSAAILENGTIKLRDGGKPNEFEKAFVVAPESYHTHSTKGWLLASNVKKTYPNSSLSSFLVASKGTFRTSILELFCFVTEAVLRCDTLPLNK